MISVFFGNNAEIEKVGEVESEDKLWVDLLNDFLTSKGFKNRYYRMSLDFLIMNQRISQIYTINLQ